MAEWYRQAISGVRRTTDLEQGVINTVVEGAKTVITNKRGLYTIDRYLRMHPVETVDSTRVGMDLSYCSALYELKFKLIGDVVPRRVAQQRLENYTPQFPEVDAVLAEHPDEKIQDPTTLACILIRLLEEDGADEAPEGCVDFAQMIYMSE